MWPTYLKVIAKKVPRVLNILDRFHIIRKFNQVIDEIRIGVCRRKGCRVRSLLPIKRPLRWQKLRRMRPEHIRKAMRILSGR
jgi:hypothetical protein